MGSTSSTCSQEEKWRDFTSRILRKREEQQQPLYTRWLATAGAVRFAQCIYLNSRNSMHKLRASKIITSLENGNPDIAYKEIRSIKHSIAYKGEQVITPSTVIDIGDEIRPRELIGHYTVLKKNVTETANSSETQPETKETKELYTIERDGKMMQQVERQHVYFFRKNEKLFRCITALYNSVPFSKIENSEQILEHKAKLQFNPNTGESWVTDTATKIVTNKNNTFD